MSALYADAKVETASLETGEHEWGNHGALVCNSSLHGWFRELVLRLDKLTASSELFALSLVHVPEHPIVVKGACSNTPSRRENE